MLKVNRSTYYKHFSLSPSTRTLENQKIRQCILDIHHTFNKRLGYVKVTSVLARDYGIKISPGRTYRLMKEMLLPKMSTQSPKYKYTPSKLELPNHLKQQFNPKAPNAVWVSDITYIKIKQSFAYLCVIIDLFSRKVIAYNVAYSMTSTLVIDTLHSAIRARKPQNTLIFHTDRGSQYTSFSVRKALDENNLTQSFSKPGHPWDNAVVEAFFKFLKKEELNRITIHSLEQLKLILFKYIEIFYNKQRPHAANFMLSPADFEDQYINNSDF